jgi:phosphate transport system substrate-binding protein
MGMLGARIDGRLLAAAAVVAVGCLAQPAAAQDHIWVVGAAQAQPFTTAVATRAAKAAGSLAPIIEETGSSLAFEYLCGGSGAGHPNAASVTRRMRRSELDTCRRNGVADIAEIPVGLDILVVTQSKAGPLARLSLAQLFLALARGVPGRDGELTANPNRKWSDVDAALPDVPIDLRIPPQATGTRDDLEELLLQRGAERVPATAAMTAGDGAALVRKVRTLRSDAAVTVHGTEAEVARELAANPNAIGVLGYRFLQAHRETLRGVVVEGADAEQDAYNGKYPGTRRIYLYVRKGDIATTPGLDKIGAEYVSSAALGPGGYLLKMGFVPLPADEMLQSLMLAGSLPAVRREALPE